MKRILFGAIALLAAELFIPAVSSAADATVDAAILSAYVWRGQILNNEMVLQPAFGVETAYGLTLYGWGNVDLTDKGDRKKRYTEIDFTATYSLPLEGMVGVDVGWIEYTFPVSDGGSTREVFTTISLDTLLQPALRLYWDFGDVEDYYASGGIDHTFDLSEKLSLDTGASIGFGGPHYNNYYFSSDTKTVDEASFNDGNLTAGLNYELCKSLTVGANCAYTILLDGEVKNAAWQKYKYGELFYGGVSLSYSF